MSEAGPGQGAALSRACGRAAANAIKNPNWLLKLRITLGPMIASWRRIRRLRWTHLRALQLFLGVRLLCMFVRLPAEAEPKRSLWYATWA